MTSPATSLPPFSNPSLLYRVNLAIFRRCGKLEVFYETHFPQGFATSQGVGPSSSEVPTGIGLPAVRSA